MTESQTLMGTHQWGDREEGHSGEQPAPGPHLPPRPSPPPHLRPHPCFLSWLKASGYQRERPLSYRQLFLFPLCSLLINCVSCQFTHWISLLTALQASSFSLDYHTCPLTGLSLYSAVQSFLQLRDKRPLCAGHALLGLVDAGLSRTTQSLPSARVQSGQVYTSRGGGGRPNLDLGCPEQLPGGSMARRRPEGGPGISGQTEGEDVDVACKGESLWAGGK